MITILSFQQVRFEDPETGVWRIEAATGKEEEEEEEEEQEAALPIAPLGADVEEEGGGRKKMRRKKEPPPSFLGTHLSCFSRLFHSMVCNHYLT